ILKIEKLNDNQIRCILDKEDLEQRELRLSELAYGSPKAKALFRDMMEKAAADCGFEVDNIPLMIEAIPVSLDCLILVVTKVEDPDVLDTRFSRFSSMANEEDMEDLEEDDEDLTYEMDALPFHSNPSHDETDSREDGENGHVDVLETFNKAIAAAKQDYLKKQTKTEAPQPMADQVYAFVSLDEVLRLSAYLTPFYRGDSILYKDSVQGVYYLALLRKGTDQKLYDRACTICADHGECIDTSYASLSYFKEHFKLILESDALETLQEVNGKG
ncbi:MAG: adaptor protein MecA, partial [Eubacterium sp.]|nr:adaptor protein MecA [Eubacterium sp.]